LSRHLKEGIIIAGGAFDYENLADVLTEPRDNENKNNFLTALLVIPL